MAVLMAVKVDSSGAGLTWAEQRKAALAEFEKRAAMSALELSGGNVTRAAIQLGLDRVYFHRVLRRHRLTKPRSAK